MANSDNRKQLFIDGVGETRFMAGSIRMDLLVMSPTRRNPDGTPVSEFVRQLVMTPYGFARMVAAIQNTLRTFEKKGLFEGEVAEAVGKAAMAAIGAPPAEPERLASGTNSDAQNSQRRPKRERPKVAAASPNF